MRGIRYKILFGLGYCAFLLISSRIPKGAAKGVGGGRVGAEGIFSKGNLVNPGGDKPEDKTFWGEDADGNPIVLGSWFQYGSYTLATAMFGTGFLVACAVTAVYYVLFVVTDPRQSQPMRRSLASDEEVAIAQVLIGIQRAVEFYEKYVKWEDKGE